MTNRTSRALPAKLVFTDTEIKLLDHLIPATEESAKETVGDYLVKLARLGGYLIHQISRDGGLVPRQVKAGGR